MNAVFKFFRSVKLAIVLILVIIVLAIFSTLVEQNKPEAYYRQAYSPALADLVIASGIGSFSRSFLFLLPTGLFVISLGVCTVDRFVGRARRGAARRYGPDIIHVSLLVLFIGALVTSFLRQEQYFTMGEGDSVALPGGYAMSLLSFVSEQYPDGRPKSWISTVNVTIGDKPRVPSFAIEVNHPLALGILKVYQTSFGVEGRLRLSDPDGKVTLVTSGQSLQLGDTEYFFAGTRSGDTDVKAVIEEWKGQTKSASSEEGQGDKVGPYRVDSVTERRVTGLTAVRDPGFLPVLAALILGAIGMALTLLQKKGRDL